MHHEPDACDMHHESQDDVAAAFEECGCDDGANPRCRARSRAIERPFWLHRGVQVQFFSVTELLTGPTFPLRINCEHLPTVRLYRESVSQSNVRNARTQAPLY